MLYMPYSAGPFAPDRITEPDRNQPTYVTPQVTVSPVVPVQADPPSTPTFTVQVKPPSTPTITPQFTETQAEPAQIDPPSTPTFTVQVKPPSTPTITPQFTETQAEPAQIDPPSTPPVLVQDTKPRLITWSTSESPQVQHAEMVLTGVARGFDVWEHLNPGLDFERADTDGDIHVTWEIEPSPHHVGLAEYVWRYSGTITLYLGDYDCNGRYVQWSQDAITESTMHEIGHILGLEHTADEEHLMYGEDEFLQYNFKTLGYNIPSTMEHGNYFAGQWELEDEMDKLDVTLAEIDTRLAGLDAEIDRVDSIYVNTVEKWGMTMSEYEAAEFVEQGLYDELVPILAEYNGLVNEYNVIIEEQEPLLSKYNRLVDRYNCYSET